MELTGAVALVTGANGGIGREYVQALRERGAARVYAAARRLEGAEELAREMDAGEESVVPVEIDITDDASVQRAVEGCGDVTLLVNNAGVGSYQTFLSAPDLSGAYADMEVNYFGTLRMCRAFAPTLQGNGGGAIVNMLTVLSRVNLPANAFYSASKAAALSLTQGVRAELAQAGTLVVAVMPGTVDTEMSVDFPDPKVSPRDVAEAALGAVERDEEDVYPGEQATEMAARLLRDPKSVEKTLAETVQGRPDRY